MQAYATMSLRTIIPEHTSSAHLFAVLMTVLPWNYR